MFGSKYGPYTGIELVPSPFPWIFDASLRVLIIKRMIRFVTRLVFSLHNVASLYSMLPLVPVREAETRD